MCRYSGGIGGTGLGAGAACLRTFVDTFVDMTRWGGRGFTADDDARCAGAARGRALEAFLLSEATTGRATRAGFGTSTSAPVTKGSGSAVRAACAGMGSDATGADGVATAVPCAASPADGNAMCDTSAVGPATRYATITSATTSVVVTIATVLPLCRSCRPAAGAIGATGACAVERTATSAAVSGTTAEAPADTAPAASPGSSG